MKVAGGQLRSGAHPPGRAPRVPGAPAGRMCHAPCERSGQAPRPGREQVRPANRWVRLALRSRLPTGYLQCPLRGWAARPPLLLFH